MTVLQLYAGKNLKMTIQLNKAQEAALSAIQGFLGDDSIDAFILRGGAGTGKTTLIARLAAELARMHLSTALLAPTGRAARILGNKVRQLTGQEIAGRTVHSCIYVLDRVEVNDTASDTNDPGIRLLFPLRDDEPTMSLIVIDESSMLGDREANGDFLQYGSGRLLKDVVTFARLKRTGREHDHLVKILFVGDPAQLPPVGEDFSAALSAEYLASEYDIATSEFDLDLVMRQAEGSGILERATEVRNAIFAGRFNSFSVAANGSDITEVEARQALDLIERSLEANASAVVVVHSNAAALEYNQIIRERLWGDAKLPVQPRDTLLVNRNSHRYGLANGDLVKVLQVDPEPEIVLVPVRGSNPVELRFRSAEVDFRDFDGSVVRKQCFLLENLLQSPNREISPLEQRALLVHFRKRHQNLHSKSKEFRKLIKDDLYFNALQVKYGYALTCHKAQGGEWDTVVVDFSHVGGVRNAAFFRWAYTAITRAAKKLVVVQPPEFDVLDSGMWGGALDSELVANASETQDPTADPDWSRLSFSASIAPLMPIHQKLRANWDSKGISIDRLQHLQYCERYTVARGEARAVVQYYYNGNHRLGRFGRLPGHACDSNLAEEAVSAFQDLVAGGSSEQPDQFILEFLERLDIALDNSGIQRVGYKAMPYRLRVGFSDTNRTGDIDFTYDGKFTWTKAQEVGGPGATSGLYDEIRRLMTVEKQ